MARSISPCELPDNLNDVKYEIMVYREFSTNRVLEDVVWRDKFKMTFDLKGKLIECKVKTGDKWRASAYCPTISNNLMRKGNFIAPRLKPSYCSIPVRNPNINQ